MAMVSDQLLVQQWVHRFLQQVFLQLVFRQQVFLLVFSL